MGLFSWLFGGRKQASQGSQGNTPSPSSKPPDPTFSFKVANTKTALHQKNIEKLHNIESGDNIDSTGYIEPSDEDGIIKLVATMTTEKNNGDIIEKKIGYIGQVPDNIAVQILPLLNNGGYFCVPSFDIFEENDGENLGIRIKVIIQ